MNRADAPPAGWYPDPEGWSRLRWWEGTDWSDRYRAPPTASEFQRRAAHAGLPVRPGVVAPGMPEPAALRRASMTRPEVDEIVSQVRDIARSEVDRAAGAFGQQARAATKQFQPLITEYTNKVFRWLRIAAVVAVMLVIAWFVFQTIAQVTFFEWLGDRIDNVTNN